MLFCSSSVLLVETTADRALVEQLLVMYCWAKCRTQKVRQNTRKKDARKQEHKHGMKQTRDEARL